MAQSWTLWLHHATASSKASGAVGLAFLILLTLYLWNLNRLLSRVPPEVARAIPQRWITQQLKATYERLRRNPILPSSYAKSLPPRLSRRYIVTGGSGLVGGHIVLQLLERGQPPEAIRIVDFQAPHRADMVYPTATGPVTRVCFRKTDIASVESTEAAFSAPWDESVAGLPLTVFHTAAVIIPSARSELVNGFCESVNVQGTRNVLAAARKAGADVFVSTSSASIAIRPVQFWATLWKWGSFPPYFWQVLDESDFYAPLRPHDEFFGNYPASKAKAERIVCAANSRAMRTGCIRPGNGVYGHPTDNLLGTPLAMKTYPTWVESIAQSFIHGINCGLVHLQFEAILADPESSTSPQAGRPFCVTDPGPPIYYGDMYHAMKTLVVTPFRIISVPPLPMLLISYVIEFYNLLPARIPSLQKILPGLPGGSAHLQPGLFSICTHLLADMSEAQKPVGQGGLGYRGVVTTLEGMCQEILDWNLEQEEHARGEVSARVPKNADGGVEPNGKPVMKLFRTSVLLAEEIQKLGGVGQTVKP